MFGGEKQYGKKVLEPYQTLADNSKAREILKWNPTGDLPTCDCKIQKRIKYKITDMQKIFIDCGAHCGESILEAKKRFGDDIKVISFEANPNLAIPLQEHFKNDSNVEINNAAVWIED